MVTQSCKYHFGGSATPCGGKQCKTCIPFILFKFVVIFISGSLIGLAGLMLVENNPASELIRSINTNKLIKEDVNSSISEINAAIKDIEFDINQLKQRIQEDRKWKH